MLPALVVAPKGVGRLRAGHPWVYGSDVHEEPGRPPGLVRMVDERGKGLGTALYSPASLIRLRWLAPEGVAVDGPWWRGMVGAALARRAAITDTAYRVVHAEGDGLPSLMLDRYGEYAVAQLLSSGLEAVRGDVVDAIRDALGPRGLLLRNDAPVRDRERLARAVELAFGTVPERIEFVEAGLRFVAAPWSGQKTGAFLDQRENRALVGPLGRGRCLDLFAHQGSFAVHLAAGGAEEVVAVESSADALRALDENAALNGISSVRGVEANAFDWLRQAAAGPVRHDVIVLDPPSFARDRRSLPRALAGYKELNLRAMRLLAPGGHLFTATCSHHVHRSDFFAMLADAAADSGRRLQLLEIRAAAADHPELVTVPETGYLKAALLRAVD
ncbi:MAG: class I SAM-dependent rRNA methyltransferase [Gemmatimonadetes bacterium]|nr:class I SAM-dependent rRNA methyltransferase [Gemmatimonadota bacterium]